MPNGIPYQKMDGRLITGINPRDIQEKALPQRKEITTDRIIDEVMKQRAQTNYDPNQIIYFIDVVRRILMD